MTLSEIRDRLKSPSGSGASFTARCPAHEDGRSSLSITQGADGRILMKCHAGCTAEAVCAAMGLKLADLFPEQRNGHSKAVIVDTYDYRDEKGTLLFQVCRLEPKDFRQRRPDRSAMDGWSWSTKGVRRIPFRLPELLAAIAEHRPVYIAEGEKDCLAIVDHGFAATCNAGGALKWSSAFAEYFKGAEVIVVADKDEPGRKHAAHVASSLTGTASSVRIIEVPDVDGKPCKDAHDYFSAGGGAAELDELAQSAKVFKATAPNAALQEYGFTDTTDTPDKRRLTLRSPSEILAMQFDDSDNILGDYVLAKGQSLAIVAQGGIGKTRISLQLPAEIILGAKFLGLETKGRDLRWLFLQTENTNRRLNSDLGRVRAYVDKEWDRFDKQVVIHTLENDTDGFVTLDSIENQSAIMQAIEETRPDVVVVDPLNDFGVGDLSKDADMKATLQTLSRVCRRGNPERAIVVLHHALTGKGGALKATGFDRASFGRNSKVLFAWTRAQLNLAPVDPDSNDRLIVACGKCSNGREFKPFGIRLNPDSMIYDIDPSIDVAEWEKDIAGQKSNAPLMTSDRVAELINSVATKKELAKAIVEDSGCYRTAAYRYIAKAVDRTIKHNKANDTYTRK